MSYLHRTTQGRVVYDRKVHFFKWKDAERIVDKIEAPAVFDVIFEKSDRKEFVAMLRIWATITERLVGYFKVRGNVQPVFGISDSWKPFRRGLVGYINLWKRIRIYLQEED